MKNLLCLISLLLVPWAGFSQQGQPPARDTTQGGLPRLEIPEITIVGKRAITLPFARKGEIYDVTLYEAPPPDSSLLVRRPHLELPVGSLPRYEEPLVPWHASALGSIGSFSTGRLKAFADYRGAGWGISGNAGLATTGGHVDNSSGRLLQAEALANSLVKTDNTILRSMRASAFLKLVHETYGMYGLLLPAPGSVDRSRNDVVLEGRLASLGGESSKLSVKLSAAILSVTDRWSGADSTASAVSPEVALSYEGSTGGVQLATGLSWRSSSLDYPMSVQSPSLLDYRLSARFALRDQLSLKLGAAYQQGAGTDGESRTLAAPFAVLSWEPDRDRKLSFWLTPEMQLASYSDRMHAAPYLSPELSLVPERTPIKLGTTMFFNSRSASFELEGSFAKGTGIGVQLADSGRIRMEYVDATRFRVQADAHLQVADETKLRLSARLEPAFEDGTTTQLAMTPIARFGARADMNIPSAPLVVFSTAEYSSKQNVDRDATRTLGDRLIIGVGAMTSVLPQTLISLSVENLFNTAYDWWEGYVAPGREITLEARVNIR